MIVVKEMAVTPAEFRQMLITSAGKGAITVLQDHIVLKTDHGDLPITLEPLPPRIIAALELPVTRVEFNYSGWDSGKQQIQQQWLDLHLRRGGG